MVSLTALEPELYNPTDATTITFSVFRLTTTDKETIVVPGDEVADRLTPLAVLKPRYLTTKLVGKNNDIQPPRF
jgi:hypothetical protein